MDNNQNVYQYKKPEFNKYKGILKLAVGFVVLIILLSIAFNAFTFTVEEREQVVVKQWGKIVKVVVDEKTDEIVEQIHNYNEDIKIVGGKGLFLKLPIIQTTESYKNMLLTYDTDPREVTTKDKKKLLIDNYAQWKIKNPVLFIGVLKTQKEAFQRLDDIIYSMLNEEIGKVDAHVVISERDYVMKMLKRITENTNEKLAGSGVEVVDVRIKRTDLPIENYENVFNRMRTERQQAASKYRSEGEEEAQKIRSSADKEATIIEAQAYEKAEKIKGEGDAEALRIYAEAYNKDIEFYEFWRTLQAYKEILDSKTKIVIDPDSEFAKYLFGSE